MSAPSKAPAQGAYTQLEFIPGFKVEIVTTAPAIQLPDGRLIHLGSPGGKQRVEIDERNEIGNRMVRACNSVERLEREREAALGALRNAAAALNDCAQQSNGPSMIASLDAAKAYEAEVFALLAKMEGAAL